MAGQEIVVIGRRAVSNHGTTVSSWLFQAARNGSGSGNGGQGGGGSGNQTVFNSEAQLMEAINEMAPGDRIILKMPGMPTVVIDGDLARGFFAAAFNHMVGLMATIADGRLEAAMDRIPASARPMVRDLIDDFREAAQEGTFVRISNTSNLTAAVQQFIPNRVMADDDTGFTWTAPVSDTGNFDGDVNTVRYHQIYFDISRVTQLQNNTTSAHGHERRYDSFLIQLYHELFHIMEGDVSGDAEITRLGYTQANHDYAFDRAAAALYNQIRFMETDLTITGEAPLAQLHLGTTGNDSLSVYLGMGGTASIDLGDGDDTVYVPFSQSLVDTGFGNDRLVVQNGQGRLIWMDEGGTDVLEISGASSLADLAVERFGQWTYVGLKGAGDANKSASELSNMIMFEDRHGPETLIVGGISYSIAHLDTLANSKPDFYHALTLSFEAPFYGGLISNLPAVDFDGDQLSYSVVSVAGVGAGSSWWFNGSLLYTNTRWNNIPETRMTVVKVRVSDGELYQDYDVEVLWTPDPNSDGHPYRRMDLLGKGDSEWGSLAPSSFDTTGADAASFIPAWADPAIDLMQYPQTVADSHLIF